jgi:hypothetical protein
MNVLTSSLRLLSENIKKIDILISIEEQPHTQNNQSAILCYFLETDFADIRILRKTSARDIESAQ